MKLPLSHVVPLTALRPCVCFLLVWGVMGGKHFCLRKVVPASCLDWLQVGTWAAWTKALCPPDAYGRGTMPAPVWSLLQSRWIPWGQGLCRFAGDLEGRGHIALTRAGLSHGQQSWTRITGVPWTSAKAGDPVIESVWLGPGTSLNWLRCGASTSSLRRVRRPSTALSWGVAFTESVPWIIVEPGNPP